MNALILALILQVVSGAPSAYSDGTPSTLPADSSDQVDVSPARQSQFPGWFAASRNEDRAPSLLPSWVSGILDSPVLHTPIHLKVSRSGFTLGYGFSFCL